MFKLGLETLESGLKKRFFSVQTSTEKIKNTKSYQNTVFLPKTKFPNYLKPKQVVKRDKRIYQEAGFSELYSWQRENLRGEEYVLHDGPPYANGFPHIGHAINKILKDIILRAQMIQGNRVHYVPGWDCHGLPIELIALKTVKEKLSPVEVRQKAREVASFMSKIQMEAFKKWGVLGDWNNQCYFTYDSKYVVNQLQIFWKLLEKDLIYYDLKPVYWSPSSETALAEAELINKSDEIQAVTVRLETVQDSGSEPLYLLVWTTTPWSLPVNKAVYVSSKFKYSIVKISSFPGLYIMATDLIKKLQEKLEKEITHHSFISVGEILNLKYRHPWKRNEVMSVFESSNLKLFGTGLLHLVPELGHDDFAIGLKDKLPVGNSVDEKGCYTAEVGPELEGLYVLDEGTKFVLDRLLPEIILKETIEHNHFYDWRTNKPVIIRASKQWFIDCEQLKDRALESLKDVEVSLQYFKSRLKDRQYWCLSRQRVWGVPIPVFYHKKSNRPLLSKNLIDHLCRVFESSGLDAWWTEKLETLFPENICRELFVQREDVVKGKDIMDIWFDSGISWSYALDGKVSDLYLEGVDQYGGWFQSSLLTSVAVQNVAPFKKIMTHGFAVDENGKKMSKSLGNVVDPRTVVQGDNALGVDTLRWWVACHSLNTLVPVSPEILNTSNQSQCKIRLTLRFLLGALDGSSQANLQTVDHLEYLDRYILNSCYQFYESSMKLYNLYEIQKVCLKIMFFVSSEISARYVTTIKDRLYCDSHDSPRRKACLYTVNAVLQTLCHVIAPILPHLVEEIYSYLPQKNNSRLFFSKKTWAPPDFWKDESADVCIKLLDDIKKEFAHEKNKQKMSCSIQLNEQEFKLLKKMQGGQEESMDSELTAILQVAEVRLKMGDERKVCLSPTEFSICLRCRRYTANHGQELCTRCETFVSHLVVTSSPSAQPGFRIVRTCTTMLNGIGDSKTRKLKPHNFFATLNNNSPLKTLYPRLRQRSGEKRGRNLMKR